MSEYTRNTGSASHTPEPWQLFPHGKIGNADGLGVVAYLATFETEWIANANLIIAAPYLPYLVAALERCLAAMAVVSPEGAIAVLGAHDAIAKARGSV